MHFINYFSAILVLLLTAGELQSQQLTTYGLPAQLELREAGPSSIRVTLKPLTFDKEHRFPENSG